MLIVLFFITGSTSTLAGITGKASKRSQYLWRHWHRSVSDLRNVAKILSIVSSRCENVNSCSLCADYNASNAAAIDAIPCLLVTALQVYHRLTVDVAHFLSSTFYQKYW